ncbi:MAG: molybdate ABC transporter substrate-binding protein [Xanthomonadaceae bacterium]|nr:molybdate ABC transporter substrate-binding protein [Xanthomonadaceae bacterium]MDE2083395.1 molybdate ABC transporter substrate-binding protein [Xanthomonadaceae bacterium]
MRLLKTLCLAAALLAPAAAPAQHINIAAAADLKFCLDAIIASFKQAHPGSTISVSYGSSGTFATQIRENAPFDLFFSADIEYPRQLHKDGLTASAVTPYAVGRIVLWSATVDASRLTLADLARDDIGKIAIANPRHAPYGKRAEEALRASGVWNQVRAKLVFGENIAQTAQFVASGNAQVGIIALSLAMSPALSGKGRYSMIPDTLHQPLEQAFVITRHGADNGLAKAFAAYLETPESRATMTQYGFALPAQTPGR